MEFLPKIWIFGAKCVQVKWISKIGSVIFKEIPDSLSKFLAFMQKVMVLDKNSSYIRVRVLNNLLRFSAAFDYLTHLLQPQEYRSAQSKTWDLVMFRPCFILCFPDSFVRKNYTVISFKLSVVTPETNYF